VPEESGIPPIPEIHVPDMPSMFDPEDLDSTSETEDEDSEEEEEAQLPLII